MFLGVLSGVGIDAVEYSRASRFINAHRRHLKSFFLSKEYQQFQNSKSKAKTFALFFAAKEAVSKSLGIRISHPRQFRQFSISHHRGVLKASFGRLGNKDGKKLRFILKTFTDSNAIGVIAMAYEQSGIK